MVILIADLIRLIYCSQPFGYDLPTLSGILLDARNRNTQDGITGALVCRHDIYLQMLEGAEASVNAAFARIKRDDRHANIKTLVSEQMPDRLFGAWAMLHDPEKSWIWSEAEISQGALDRASSSDVTTVFANLAAKVKGGDAT